MWGLGGSAARQSLSRGTSRYYYHFLDGDQLATNMHIKLETNQPGPVVSADIPLKATLAADKKPVIVIRANEAQLTVLNDSFAKTALPNRAEMDEICKETGLYVFFWCFTQMRRDETRRTMCYKLDPSKLRLICCILPIFFCRCWCTMSDTF